MSYRDKLNKRRALRGAAVAKADTAQDEAVARATALRKHIEAEGAHEVGLVIKRAGARIVIDHPPSRTSMYIDADRGNYRAAISGPTKRTNIPAPVVVATEFEIDKFIIDFLAWNDVT